MFCKRKTRPISTAFFLIVATYILFFWLPKTQTQGRLAKPISRKDSTIRQDAIRLDKVTARYPVAKYIPLPQGSATIPRIQHEFPKENPSERNERLKRRDAVKEAFLHSWNGYKDFAWMRDELKPRTGGYEDTFNGWGATLVDSLDALIIMGLDDELQLALEALDGIDFTTTKSRQVPVFEIIIRYMGGFIAAHDLTEGKHPILLRKAVELGEMIFNAFDTHNRMPQVRWDWTRSAKHQEIFPSVRTSLAEMGSLTMEFTRLTQLTGDPKYYDAVQRVMDELELGQDKTRIPGLWPTWIDTDQMRFDDSEFTVGACADSAYEYLPKEHILLGAQTDKYRRMYEKAIAPFNENLVFRAMTKNESQHVLFTANVVAMRGDLKTFQYTPDHLKCFMGGTVAIGAKVFNRPEDMDIARGLTDGCVWAYDVMPTGIMPEIFKVSPCKQADKCPWDEEQWMSDVISQAIETEDMREKAENRIKAQGLPPGVTDIKDPAYKLRPEALESLFVMYRITGDKSLQDSAWRMFKNIDKATRTKYGHSSINDVRHERPKHDDKMESFWLAETLKYLYLIFSEPDHISLDDYVLSTEAHPFKRPKVSVR
ncbi:Class I alpha-mannosidase [Penicillium sp. DV-2018c]|nr:Class I alpha-mannosidase [Penicillium sp. DV-2018c]KAJ5583593.1 Class I alpha-mannosidase [Penicillium sp. DV-2018c]